MEAALKTALKNAMESIFYSISIIDVDFIYR
jgi:hypothetical protein